MWGPIFGWCALEQLADSIDPRNPERVALDLFDRLRLREPFAKAFSELGFEGEEGWRIAARIKVGLLTTAGVGKPAPKAHESAAVPKALAEKPETAAIEKSLPKKESSVAKPLSSGDIESGEKAVGLAPELWSDPDVRWLTGVHEADGLAYFVREPYEELLWWLLMPSLLRLAGEAAPSRIAAKEMSETVKEALSEAAAAEYRVDAMTHPDDSNVAGRDESEGNKAPQGAVEKATKTNVEEPETPSKSHSAKDDVNPKNS
jgi:hypothetical protein